MHETSPGGGGGDASQTAKLDEVDFLSDAALRLAELRPDADIFGLIAEQLARLAPEAVVATSSYEGVTGNLFVRAFAGPPALTKRLRDLLRRDVVGLTFHVDDESRLGMAESKLLRLEPGLHQLTFRAWPLEQSKEVETRLGVRSVHIQAFSRNGGFLGTAAIVSQAPSLEHARLIEAFVRLAAVALQRRCVETQLRESESRFRMLAENSQDVVFRLRLQPTTMLEYVSPASRQVLGYTPHELYAAPEIAAKSLCPGAWRAKEWQPSDEPVVLRCEHPDGSYAWTEQTGTPIRDERGRLVAVEGIVRDITPRKEAEDALIEADRRKDDFLAVLSHELRNPLSPICNGLYILDRVDPTGDHAKRARATIERQVTQLTRLIDDLLDVTRISRGKIRLHLRHVDLNQLVRSTIEDHRAMFADAQISLDVVPAPHEVWVDADATRIAQIIGNLLHNAAKFTPPGGTTRVSVQAEGEDAVLRVRDDGAGLAPEIVPHLFEPFMQADRTLDRSKGGLGLGLMLVKGLVDMHGGSVTVASKGPGKGTEFTIRLPVARAAASADESGRGASSPPEARRVLVIEDNVDAANSLREALELGPNTVQVAHDGLEGLEKARAFAPDVVICDIGLPGMDGYTVARSMRESPELRAISLVALTGYASPDDLAKSRQAGFDRHLAKPPDIEALENIVAELSERTARERDREGRSARVE